MFSQGDDCHDSEVENNVTSEAAVRGNERMERLGGRERREGAGGRKEEYWSREGNKISRSGTKNKINRKICKGMKWKT